MPARWNPPDLDDLIRRYQAGETCVQLGAEFGVDSRAVKAALARAGVPTRGRAECNRDRLLWTPDDPESIVAAYGTGRSPASLAAEHGVSEICMIRLLREHGARLRDMRESALIARAAMTPEQRKANVSAANSAVRGSRRSEESMVRTAMTRERQGVVSSTFEQQMIGWLIGYGCSPTPQVAVGRYNVDIALPPVAVELQVTTVDDRRRARAAQRCRYILDAGWNLMFIWIDPRRYGLRMAAAEQVVAFLDQSGRDPSLRGQHRVIFGDGRPVAVTSDDFHEIAFVPSRRGGQGPRA